MIGAKTVMGQECTISAFQHVCDRPRVHRRRPRDADRLRPRRRGGRAARSGCRASTSATSTWATTAGSATAHASCAASTVGDNAVVGTSSVITEDVPANPSAAGVPARVLRMRDEPRDAALALSRRRRSQVPARRGVPRGPGRCRAARAAWPPSRPGRTPGPLAGSPRAAERAPGGARELVLAAVPAAGRDRGRVAARLALRDARERGRSRSWPGRRRLRRRREAEMPRLPSVGRAGDAVDDRPWLRW